MLFTAEATATLPHARRAQSAEPSPYDAQIANCQSSASSSAALTLTQTSATAASVTRSGYASAPSMMWLTDTAGTVIAFQSGSIGSSTTFTWPAVPHPQPGEVRPHSCPPSYNISSSVQLWRGLYEESLAICCADSVASAATAALYEPTIRVNLQDWRLQRTRVTASSRALVLNYIKDSTGAVIHAERGAASGSYTATVPFTPLATSIEACALIDAEGSLNPICVNTSLVPNIASALEASSANPVSVASLAAMEMVVRYAGSPTAPLALFTHNRSGYCVTYVRDAAGDPISLAANGSVTLQLSGMSGSATLYTCCGVTVSAGSNPPIICPDGALLATTLDVATLTTDAAVALQLSRASGGFGTLSTGVSTGGTCDNVYRVGQWVLNTAGDNCTCTQPSMGTAAWSCRPPSSPDLGWTGGQTALIVIMIIVGLLVLLLGVRHLHKRHQLALNSKPPREIVTAAHVEMETSRF